MQEIVVYEFKKAFYEKIRQKAEKVARKFPGVTSAVCVKEQGLLKVTGEFVKFKLAKKLSKIDKNVDIIKIEPVEELPAPRINVQRVNNQPQKKEEEVKPPQANGWNLPNLQPLWKQGKNLAAGLGGLYNQKKVKEAPQQKRGNFPVYQDVKGTDPLVKQGKQIFAGVLRYFGVQEVKKENPWNKRVNARDLQGPNNGRM